MNETEDLKAIYNPEGSELRTLQLKMLDILVVVTDICDKHNLPYWVSGGTLLGAVRHRGFIPWDDDIDIELLRPDYLELLRILPKELPDNLYLQTPEEKSYRLLFSKVRDRYSIVHSEEENMARYKEKGIFIDIFSEERSYRWMKDIVDFFYGRAFRRLKRGRPFHSLKFFYEYATSLVLYPVGVLLIWIARGICAITKPDNILHSYGIGNSTNHNARYMFPVGKVTFEGKEFSAPKEVDTYLRKQYGDYMTVPPKEKRATHFLKVEYL
ncbi:MULTISPECIES: LicD family protein [unclassified Dysgonomonas]|jgi:lipopolysaccharide cholinephosphotransferase|uniref:LicD family protein n=1 Tax=unclassified Dysgonomonas TaxID=2630389 RepID=UPI0025C3F2CA|nr:MULTISPECIES: LicD family protein [unclassified Dysgonomonas]MDR2003814.1 LicD family protein [Prevotella sp.]HMM03252.1 LicD family protein [Dysgonomonas sp.]